MLQVISISNKCCSFELSIHLRIRKNSICTLFTIDNTQRCFLTSRSAYENDFWRSCDTEENSALQHMNKLHFTIYSNWKQLFKIVIFQKIYLLYLKNKCSLGEHKRFFQKENRFLMYNRVLFFKSYCIVLHSNKTRPFGIKSHERTRNHTGFSFLVKSYRACDPSGNHNRPVRNYMFLYEPDDSHRISTEFPLGILYKVWLIAFLEDLKGS